MPSLLNGKLSIVSYDGGTHEDSPEHIIENCLTIPPTKLFHCSAVGENFNLVLKSEIPLKITHVVIHKAPECTASIQTGALHVTNEPPTEEQLDSWCDLSLPVTREGDSPHLFFRLPSQPRHLAYKLNKWLEGTYFHFKFIQPEADNNIDVGFLGLVGFYSSLSPPDYMDLECPADVLPTKLQPWNLLAEDIYSFLENDDVGLLFSDDEKIISIVKEFTQSTPPPPIPIIHCPSSAAIAFHLRKSIGCEDNAFVISKALDAYNLMNEEFTLSNLETFTGTKFEIPFRPFGKPMAYKTQERTPDDRDPTHPSLYRITASNFTELICDTDHHFLVVVMSSWSGPGAQVIPVLLQLAELLKSTNIRIGILDCDLNKPPPSLSEMLIPNIKLFVAGAFPAAHLTGNRSLQAFLWFLEANITQGIEWADLIKQGKTITSVNTMEATREATQKKIEAVEGLVPSLSETLLEDWKAMMEIMNTYSVINADTDELQFEKAIRSFGLCPSYTALLHLQEQKLQKNIKRADTEAEYKEYFEQAKTAGKVILVYFTQDGCLPCHHISPFYANLSEEFSNVLFLKVDVDEVPTITEKEKITELPTFKGFKGDIIAVLVGADQGRLEEMIKQLSAP